jgi:hypothetical protein
MEMLRGQEALDALIGVLPYVIRALPQDMLMCVTDGIRYLQVVEGDDLKVGMTVGAEVLGAATAKCVKENRVTVFNVKEATGFIPFKGVNVPILGEDGLPVGTLICGIGRKKQQDLNKVAKLLSDSLDQMTLAINEIAEKAARLSVVEQGLYEETQNLNRKMQETKSILIGIKKLYNQTNLLGINASIEAARAGAYGKPFSVIAQEIRKLAEDSQAEAEEIDEITSGILAATDGMISSVEESRNIADQQAAITQENAASIKELQSLAYAVKSMAEIL